MLNDHCIMISISHLDYGKCEDWGLLSAKKRNMAKNWP